MMLFQQWPIFVENDVFLNNRELKPLAYNFVRAKRAKTRIRQRDWLKFKQARFYQHGSQPEVNPAVIDGAVSTSSCKTKWIYAP